MIFYNKCPGSADDNTLVIPRIKYNKVRSLLDHFTTEIILPVWYLCSYVK